MRKLVLLLLLALAPVSAADAAQVAMVQEQIEMARQRLTGYKTELVSALTRLQQDPNGAAFQAIKDLQDKIQRQTNVINTYQLALRDAQAAESWGALLSDMAKQSSFLAAVADSSVAIYQAGKWIYGASDEEIYGENWQQVESYNAQLVEEARKVREESKAILGALDQIKTRIDAGVGAEELRPFADTLLQRLKELQERGDKVKKNIRLLVRIYRAEKENLPASVLFHGEFMGRYTEQVLAEFDNSKLFDLFLDLVKVDGIDVLIKLVKPMVKTAIGDYLARSGGGSHLTPEITDDLVFNILFGGETGFESVIWDKGMDVAGGFAIKELVKGAVTSEANRVIQKSNQAFYAAMKKSVQNAKDIAEEQLVKETTDQLVKEHKTLIETGAKARLKKLIDTGEAIKKIWDLVLKDVVQAYLQKDVFYKTVKLADDACAGFREEWKKVQNDTILTENEYVNYRWFKSGKSAATPPKGVIGGNSSAKDRYLAMDLDKAKALADERKALREQESGGAQLEDFDAYENEQVNAVCSGQIPFDRIIIPDLGDVVRQTAINLFAPCDQLNGERKLAIDTEDAACKTQYKNTLEYRSCWSLRVKPLLDAKDRDHSQCIESKVYRPREEFRQRRIARLDAVTACEDKRYRDSLAKIRGELAPAMLWAQAIEGEAKKLQELIQKLGLSGDRMPPVLSELPASIQEGVQDAPYNTVLAGERVAQVKGNLALSQNFNLESIENALSRVDFVFDESILMNIPSMPQLCKKHEVNLSGSTTCKEYYVLSEESIPLAKERALLSSVNPFTVQDMVEKARQVPELANRSWMETLAGFVPQEGLNLYRQGIAQNRRAAEAMARVDAALKEIEGNSGSAFLQEIGNFYHNIFVPWRVRRIPTLLGMDLDQLDRYVAELKQKFEAAKKVVLPDPARLKGALEEAAQFTQAYREGYRQYGAYRLRFFPEQPLAELSLPDFAALKGKFAEIEFLEDRYGAEYEAASEAMQELDKELEAMHRQETQHLADLEVYLKKLAAISDAAAVACSGLPGDPPKCLKAVAEGMEKRRSIVLPEAVLSFMPSKKYAEQRNKILSTAGPKKNLEDFEAAAQAAIKDAEEEKARELQDAQSEAPRRIADFYEQFRRAYEARNESQVVSNLGDHWESGDGTTLADLEGYLRNSFSVFDDIRYKQSNLQVFPVSQTVWRATYDLSITGRIFADDLSHEEKSSVSEELAFDEQGKLKIVRTTGGRFWSIQ